jgi:hypothetical protein
MKTGIIFLIFVVAFPCFGKNVFQSVSGDTFYVRVYFLYGSRPKHAHRHQELKWFGGKLGGHVGLGTDSLRILNFLPNGRVKLFPNDGDPSALFAEDRWNEFRESLGGTADSNKTSTFIIPINQQQKAILDSITSAYLKKVPYDYAFFGMRCAAAAHDVLGQMGLVESYPRRRTIFKIFYPIKLRKRLFYLAAKNHWVVEGREGSLTRKWERN